ncbi:LptE family protein [Sphingobacterium lactis]|uniref:LptE family protein n=1 Tax=Sphingobacterium lactis TaxID=797291 RepID=UPI003EC4CCD6
MKGTFVGYILLAALMVFTIQGCGVKYSLSGGSIPEGMNTYSVEIFENISPFVSATLSQQFTEGLKERIRTQSKLSQVNQDGDAMFSGVITNYVITPAAVEAGVDRAALNRLSITVKVKYVNRKDESGESDFEESFTQFKEFRGEVSTQESSLNSEIVKMLTEDVFNKAFNNW